MGFETGDLHKEVSSNYKFSSSEKTFGASFVLMEGIFEKKRQLLETISVMRGKKFHPGRTASPLGQFAFK